MQQNYDLKTCYPAAIGNPDTALSDELRRLEICCENYRHNERLNSFTVPEQGCKYL